VDFGSNDLFACSGIPLNDHGEIVFGKPAYERTDLAHLMAIGNKAMLEERAAFPAPIIAVSGVLHNRVLMALVVNVRFAYRTVSHETRPGKRRSRRVDKRALRPGDADGYNTDVYRSIRVLMNDMYSMKKYLSQIAITAGAAALLAPVAALGAFHEQLQKDAAGKREKIQQEREELKQKIEDQRDTIKEKGHAIKEELKERTTAIKQELEVRRTAAKQQMQTEIKKLRDDFRGKAEARKEEMNKKFGEKRSERIEQFFAKMVEKFERAIDRLDTLAEKIQTRINAATAQGKDMTNAHANLAVAQGKIDEAEKGLADAKAKYAELGATADAKKKFAEVKALVQDVEQKVKDAHAALVRTIADTKGMGTTTATTNPSQ